MSPVDKQLIIRKAKLIDEDLVKLREFEQISFEDYMGSFEKKLQVERLLERIIGRVIDLNFHLLKEEFQTIPPDYYQSFILLGRKGALEKEFAENIAGSSGLRNFLAHEYDEIDDAQVYAAISTCLDQVPQYLDRILEKFV